MSKRGRVDRQQYAAPPCPEDPDHGPLLAWGPGRWHCPHVGHQRLGFPQTPSFFTDEDLKEIKK